MGNRVLGAALIILVLSTKALVAQQPEHRAPGDSAERGKMMMNMERQMRAMDSMNARLDTLVSRMNRATGNAKVSVMAQVINELVLQRRAMHMHMREMMRSHGRMRGGAMMRGGRADTGRTAMPDTSGHAEHHPGQ